jgi:hypothetical protein
MKFAKLLKEVALLKENPDGIDIGEYSLTWYDLEAIPFGWHNNEFLFGDWGETHPIPNEKTGYWIKRSDLKYPGRLWKKSKVISFWEYPDKSQFKKCAKDIKENLMIDIMKKPWKIEVLINKVGKFIIPKSKSWSEEEYFSSDTINVLVPTNEYVGSSKRTEDELRMLHALSPADSRKIDRKVYQKKLSLPKGVSTAEYKYLTTKYKFTEWLINY